MAKVLEPGSALRLQLEGRWERIEQAQERYAALTRLLGSWGWRGELRLQPGLPAEIRAHESELEEVLEYVERRARSEHWPASHPGPASLRAIRAQRGRLEALARKRLAPVLPERGTSFDEVLGQLESLALAPVPQPPAQDEPVLLEGEPWLAQGRFWLTPERLVWHPWQGEPEQVSLNTVDPGSITLLPGGLGVRVAGERHITITSPLMARPLANLLQLYRRLPERSQPLIHAQQVICRRAFRDTEGSGRSADEQWGISVFRPGYLAFLPERRPTLLERARRFVGMGGHRDLPEYRRLERLLEHLRQLPVEDFDRCVREVARARGGTLWKAASVRRMSTLLGPGIRFTARGQILVVPRDSGLDGALEQFVGRNWFRGEELARVGRPGWWARHYKSALLVGAGALLQGSPILTMPFRPGWLSLFGIAGLSLYILGWMRYVRAKGLPPLLGLLGLVSCPGWIILLFLPDKNKPPSGSE